MRDLKFRVDDRFGDAIDEAARGKGVSRAQWLREAAWMRMEHDRYDDRLGRVERQLRQQSAEIRRLQRRLDDV